MRDATTFTKPVFILFFIMLTLMAAGSEPVSKQGDMGGESPPEFTQSSILSAMDHQAAAVIQKALNRSTSGLKATFNKDGSILLPLDGRFQFVKVAYISADAQRIQTCVNNLVDLDRFLQASREKLAAMAREQEVANVR